MSQQPDNMQAFNLVAAELFNRLYQRFPLPLDVEPRALYWDARRASIENHETDNPSSQDILAFEVAAHTLEWLETEGFVRCEAKFLGGEWNGMVLIEKGLTVLNGVPEAVLQRREPLIKRLREAIATESPRVAVERVGEAIAALIAAGASAPLGA